MSLIIFSVSQGIDQREPRTNLTVRVTVLTNETDDLNLGGDGAWAAAHGHPVETAATEGDRAGASS